ncbi:AAA family ATPase [Sphingomonas sp.]|uniref:AAA family ATPase n=1 Tax=Sphingomonas sp. TaxID=28214 RepID=UPI00286C7EF5|nr:AAA family ATPase [Sphingomonas sp.]
MILGHASAIDRFLGAWASGAMHHAWLLTGPRGIGKASFARAAATRMLAEAAGPLIVGAGIETPENHPTAHLINAGSHPDYRFLERILNKTGTALQRNISVDQVRALGDLFSVTPAMSDWRAVVIDSADDLDRSGANALLKMLEEPPAKCVFLLVSHVPGRLLPTIRSRCTTLDFQPLGDDVMASILAEQGQDSTKIPALIQRAGGSPGTALSYAALDLAPLHDQALAIMRAGDPFNERRARLAQSLSLKASADRYAAFLQIVPTMIADEAKILDGPARLRALDAYRRARDTCQLAPRLSFDPGATIFQLGTILASVAPEGASV